MFRQARSIEDISHCGVWPRWRMTGISEKINWLCVRCLLSAGHCFSAALISGAEPKLKPRPSWQACCLARLSLSLSLGVLRLTGTHLFKVAAETYYSPPVVSLRFVQMLLSAPQDPAGPATRPPLHFNDTSVLNYGNGQYVFGQNSRKQGWWNRAAHFLDSQVVLLALTPHTTQSFCLQILCLLLQGTGRVCRQSGARKVHTLPKMTWY